MNNRKTKLIVSLLTSTAIMFGVNTPAGAANIYDSDDAFGIPRIITFDKYGNYNKFLFSGNDDSDIFTGGKISKMNYLSAPKSFLYRSGIREEIFNKYRENKTGKTIYYFFK